MAAPCAGAAIPSWGATGHWVLATCQSGPDGVSDISVMAGPVLVVEDGSGLSLAGALVDGPGGSGVNPQ